MDVKQIVTDRIIEELEKGHIPWQKPWFGISCAYSRVTKRPYSFLNQMLLGEPGEYLTFKQINDLGGKIKKGEKSKIVVFWTFLEQKNSEGEVEDLLKKVPYLKYYRVFNINQTEGIEPITDYNKRFDTKENVELEDLANGYFERESIKVIKEEGGNKASYSPKEDRIRIPSIKSFLLQEEYYSTLYHEMTHSTGHKDRLNRDGVSGDIKFGSEVYAKEELIAELGAASLLHMSGFDSEATIKNSAGYIESWLSALKNDKNLIVSAASKAEKAVNYILGNTEKGETVCE